MLNKKTLEGIKRDALDEAVKNVVAGKSIESSDWFRLATAADIIINSIKFDKRKKK